MVGKTISFGIYICCFAVQILTSTVSVGQNVTTFTLEEVQISGSRLSEFAIGATTSEIDSTIITLNRVSSLAEILNDYSSTQIKSYGNGMLSSISFRGTGPEHTAILWHGINIAYPMLGQSDLALLPIFFSDQVIIQHGTGSSLYGSGALGGTISLGSSRPSPGFEMNVSHWLGSFGTNDSQVQLSQASKKSYIKLSANWMKSVNDFKFVNTTKIGTPKERQQNAGFDQFGLNLEAALKLSHHGLIELSGQYNNTHRTLQPSMNVSGGLADIQDDENLRLRAAYSWDGTKADWNVQYAFLRDKIGYNGQSSISNQHVVKTTVSHSFLPTLQVMAAADLTLIAISSPFYREANTSENRANIWASVKSTPISWLVLSVNLRQPFHSRIQAPLSPSFGAEIYLIDTKANSLRINSMVTKGFRLPTLNELYWEPGGNLSLIPEQSYSFEFSISGSSEKNIGLYYTLTGYRMWVDNWILWRPQGNIWSPENIKEVDVYGLEVIGSLKHQLGNLHLNWQTSYALTRSINRTGLDQFDRSTGKQLSYVPIHKGVFTVSGVFENWTFLVNTNFTGERYTTADNESSLPAYVLLNLRASRTFKIRNLLLSGSALINNAFNTSYQSVQNKAMPGINFLLGITLAFNK